MSTSSEDRFVTVVTLFDPSRAQMAEELLSQASISCTIQGARHAAALAPIGGGYIPIPVQVPSSQAAEAREVLEAFGILDAVPVTEQDAPVLDAHAERVGSEDPVPLPTSHSWMQLVAIWLIAQCGTGHFFAREFVSGSMILLAELWLVVNMFGAREDEVGAVFGALAVVSAYDLLDGLYGLRRRAQGRTRSRIKQVLMTGSLTALALGIVLVATRR
ncbi:MAG: DUF2007 domain-containing protein [Sandaracinaceae bacterium]|nr:DUF2007 domain-containing protein [Sandaracinaceae bacterium]